MKLKNWMHTLSTVCNFLATMYILDMKYVSENEYTEIVVAILGSFR